MSITTAFRKYTRSLTANEEINLNVSPSNVVLCFEGDSEFTIKPNGQNPCTIEKGVSISFDGEFTDLRMISATTQTIEVYVGRGSIQDNRIIGSVAIEGNPAANVSYGTVTCNATITLLLAANISRATAVIQNNGTEAIYIGWDSSVTVANGLKLAAGAIMEVTNQATIYGISTTTTNNVRYSEEGGA